MFKRLAANPAALRVICRAYGAGDPDPRDPGGYSMVQFKQFAADFDNVRLPSERGPSMESLTSVLNDLRVLRKTATKQKLDLTDAFEEAAGRGRDANLGIMAKNRFRSAMGAMFKGDASTAVLDGICRVYGTGDKDPRDPSSYQKVLFKQFAVDFDNLSMPPEAAILAPEALMADLRVLRLEAQDKRLDMTDLFESYAGKGREAQLGIMPKNRFQAAMADMFKGVAVSMSTLDQIAVTYGTGDPDPRDPGEFLKVKFKQFALDFDRIPVPQEKPKNAFDHQMILALADLKGEAVRRKLDMSNCFEEYAGSGVDYNLGIMPKNRFCGTIAVLFPSISLSAELFERICASYPAGDPDPSGGFQKVRWREFANDFDDQVPTPWHAGKAPPPRAL